MLAVETGVSASEWLEYPRDLATAFDYIQERNEEMKRRR